MVAVGNSATFSLSDNLHLSASLEIAPCSPRLLVIQPSFHVWTPTSVTPLHVLPLSLLRFHLEEPDLLQRSLNQKPYKTRRELAAWRGLGFVCAALCWEVGTNTTSSPSCSSNLAFSRHSVSVRRWCRCQVSSAHRSHLLCINQYTQSWKRSSGRSWESLWAEEWDYWWGLWWTVMFKIYNKPFFSLGWDPVF